MVTQMMFVPLGILAAVAVASWGVSGRLDTQRPVGQNALAVQILSESLGERRRALESIDRIPVDDIGAGLRAALFQSLRQEAAIHFARYRAGRAGGPMPELQDPTFVGALTRSIARLNDPESIPALADAMGFGYAAIHALARFGDVAAKRILDMVNSSDTIHYVVDGGLTALRFMIEAPRGEPLPASTRESIRLAVVKRLAGKEYFTTVWSAIDTASVLGDPGLSSVLQSIARDEGAVTARGITDPELIARTQKRAADRLAGIPALPRPPR
jgi:hypothetical protein